MVYVNRRNRDRSFTFAGFFFPGCYNLSLALSRRAIGRSSRGTQWELTYCSGLDFTTDGQLVDPVSIFVLPKTGE